jgi:hypothetical protein
MPARNQSYENSGEQSNSTKGGQRKPSRKMKNGSNTTTDDVNEEKEYIKKKEEEEEQEEEDRKDDEEQWFRPNKDKNRTVKAFARGKKDDETEVTESRERPEEGTSFNETDAVKGYGKPTKGSYNSTEKGYKTFGTEGQGNNTEGCKDKDSSTRSARGMYVTVTAVADQGSDTILLEVGNYDFLEEYVWDEKTSARVV